MNKNSQDPGSRFLSSSLHEIRTPIQTIISTIELLHDTSLNTEQTEYVRQIEFSANVLLQLANNVLDFTKLRTNEFKMEKIPFNVIELIERTVDLISMDAFAKGLEMITNIDYNIPHIINGDQMRLQQIILNLVKNAVKFTHEGYISINAKQKGSLLEFKVIDSGIGIPEENRKMIFNDYYQVDASTTRKYGGSGLGLSIARELVLKMGGEISVDANPEGGSIFKFTIPLDYSEQNLNEEFNESIAPFNAPEDSRVLIIDDNELSAKALEAKLKYMGFKSIHICTSALEGIDELKHKQKKNAKQYTLIFVDLIMPRMDGWRFAAELNAFEDIKKIPKYLMIPEGQLGGDAKMKMLDWYSGYISKPVKYHNLINLLKENYSEPAELLPVDAEDEGNVEEPKLELTETNLPAEMMNILVAEDHPVNRKLMYAMLIRFGANVYLAEDGQQAIDQCLEHDDIDLVFMDIQMPVKNGTDATAELRQKGFKGIIIACTANSNQDDFEEYKKTGINDILVKPFKRDEIKLLLEKWSTVLSIPEARTVLELPQVNNFAKDLWDLAACENECIKNKTNAKAFVSSTVSQMQTLLEEIFYHNQTNPPDYKLIQRKSEFLAQKTLDLKSQRLTEHATKMAQSALLQDNISVEAVRTDFAIDFMEFKNLVKQWQSSQR